MKYNKPKKPEYRSLSKDEIYLISRAEYEKQKLITTDFAKKLFKDAKKAANILDKLKRKGRLIQIERGKYVVVPIGAPYQLWKPNEYVTAKLWMGSAPYYIGYFTMYNYWGFTEQIPQTMFILNTKKSQTKIIAGIRFKAVRINTKKYYGIEKVKMGDEIICISDKERTLVDFVYSPITSFKKVENVIKENISKINIDKFINYLIVFPIIAVRKRAGYILEKINPRMPQLKKLKASLGKQKTLVVLNPLKSSQKGKINKDWKVIVNE